MDLVALATLLRDYGPWGLLAISFLVIAFLFNALQACQRAQIANATVIAIALTEAKLTNAAVVAALESRTGFFERLGTQVEAGSQAAEVNLKLLLAGVSENQRTLDDLRRGRS